MWKNAVIDACVVSWVMKKEHEHDPKLAVNDLCAWCHSVALDPKVSSEAKALYDRITDLLAELERVEGNRESECMECEKLACIEIRQQAARDCVEIMTGEYKRLGSFVAAFNTSVCAINLHFGLGE